MGGGIEGLYFYGARWLDVSLGRFLSADSIIPEATQGVQAWDRYAYANNNPVRYSDPTGHRISCGDGETGACGGEKVNDKTTGEKPPFDASIGENNTNEVNKDKEVNPSLLVLVPVGILLTVSSAVTEVALLYTEAVILPSVAITPPIGIIAELTITATGLALADINLAYWAYTARVANEPEKKQKLELLPFWGIK